MSILARPHTHLSTITMSPMSLSTSLSPSACKTTTNSPGLGTLATLPREVRDEIYRSLVKASYLFDKFGVFERSADTSGFAIFQVSKAVNHEANSIFYSESAFFFYLNRGLPRIILPSAPLTNRMMLVVVNIDESYCFEDSSSSWRQRIHDNLKTTVDRFSGLSVLRNTLLIRLNLTSPDLDCLLSDHFFERLKACVGFRTVLLVAEPLFAIKNNHANMERYERFVWAVKERLTSTMGSATVSRVNLKIHLFFHPLEHMRVNLSA